jgi:serpin B
MKRAAVLFCLVPVLAAPATGEQPRAREVPADVQALVRGNDAFAFDLYARLRDKDGNLFYSPYSISTALAMTYAGARGQTAEQMAKVLHFALDPARLHPAFAELIRDINGRGSPRQYQLYAAQSLWGDAGLPVHNNFQKLIRADYGADLRLMDFARQPEAARRQINRWVEQRTNDKIKDLLHKGEVDPMTRMVLVNAIYFKAAWQEPFHEYATHKDAVFHAASKEVKAALMRQTERFRYAEGEGLQALELPYKGGDVSMIIVLPREKDGLGKLEQSLTAKALEGWLSKLAPRQVAVELPRFRVEARLQLAETLAAMGMPLAFSGAADFSGISTAQNLYLSRVIHQAFVDVNEAGTEAAAATAVVAKEAAAPVPETPVVFRADHPFLFLLRDQRTGSILFLGRLTDPAGGKG